MMAGFMGFPQEGFFLLMQNKFEDSKAFYDAHKARLKELVLEPMGQIVEELAPALSALDREIVVTPSRVVSRLRRDTRFSKDQTLYRANVWVCFTRPRVEYPHIWPLFWFEIKPEESVWSAGVCIWDSPPAYMRFMKERMLAGPNEFLRAAEEATKAGAALHTEAYKKDRAPDAPEALKPYLNAKHFNFAVNAGDMALPQSPGLLDELRKHYANFAGMYHWLKACAEEFIRL